VGIYNDCGISYIVVTITQYICCYETQICKEGITNVPHMLLIGL
jgi:hypothetical protein